MGWVGRFLFCSFGEVLLVVAARNLFLVVPARSPLGRCGESFWSFLLVVPARSLVGRSGESFWSFGETFQSFGKSFFFCSRGRVGSGGFPTLPWVDAWMFAP